MNDELMREVNAAMQKERMQVIWHRFGKQLLLVAGVAMGLAILSLLYRQHVASENQARSELLLAGREQFAAKQYQQARDSFTQASEAAKNEARAMALIWVAKAAQKLDDEAGALDAYAQALAPKAEAGVFASFACINGAALAPDDARFADCLPDEAGQPLFGIAAEMRAVKAALDPKADTVVLPNPQSLPFTQRQRIEDLNIYLSSKSDAE